MFLIAFGAPGVGKGTQAKILSQILGIPHISTGEILREAAKNKIPEVMHAYEIISKGELFPDELAIKIIKNTLSEERCAKGAILDGFPRTVNQARIFEKLLEELNITDVFLLNFVANEAEVIRRLSDRRTCKACHAIFDIKSVKNIDTCPVCGAKDSFYTRAEDASEAGIRRRLTIFEQRTQPVIDFYSTFRKIIEIDSLPPIDEVTKQVLKEIAPGQ